MVLTSDQIISYKPFLDEKENTHILKIGIWVYFILLIFEGALRKWFLPGLATPLLIIRDPVAFWLIYQAWKDNLLPSTRYLSGMVVIGVLSTIMALFIGHGSLSVAIFGARILILHFPLIFIIGRIFDREDVLKLGKVLLYMSIPMAILVGLQFFSPQSTWVNRGVGGNENGAGFQGALGFFRPPGTFSFHVGTYLFFGLATPYILYYWLNPKGINRIVLYLATAGLLAVIPLSISRSLFYHVSMTVLFLIIGVTRNPKYLSRVILASIVIIVALIFLSNTSFFQTGTAAFFSRFDSASTTEGGVEGSLRGRYFGGMLIAFSQFTDLPFFGYGIGMGTNAGSALLTGEVTYLVSETEWGRMIGEMGLLLGLFAILIRLGVVFRIARACYTKLLSGDMLPWLLLSFGILNIPNNQWAQPTILGFSIMIGGLMIASLKSPAKYKLALKSEL